MTRCVDGWVPEAITRAMLTRSEPDYAYPNESGRTTTIRVYGHDVIVLRQLAFAGVAGPWYSAAVDLDGQLEETSARHTAAELLADLEALLRPVRVESVDSWERQRALNLSSGLERPFSNWWVTT